MKNLVTLSLKIFNWLAVGDIEVQGLRETSKVIAAAPHSSWMDVFVLAATFPGAKIMANSNVLNHCPILKLLGCFPSKGGIKTAIQHINEGHTVIVMPEGWTDLTSKNLREFKTGVVVIAKYTNNSVTCVRIDWNHLRGKWILAFPDPLQWFLDFLLPRARGVKVTIKEDFSIPDCLFKYRANQLRETI